MYRAVTKNNLADTASLVTAASGWNLLREALASSLWMKSSAEQFPGSIFQLLKKELLKQQKEATWLVSSEMAFKIAGGVAFKRGMEQAKPVRLEPTMNVEIYAPEENAGDIMGDLNSRRGRIQGMDVKGNTQVVRAQVPMADMLNYDSTLTSMTGGRGSFQMEISHYDIVPAHLTEKIIEKAKQEAEEDSK